MSNIEALDEIVRELEMKLLALETLQGIPYEQTTIYRNMIKRRNDETIQCRD